VGRRFKVLTYSGNTLNIEVEEKGDTLILRDLESDREIKLRVSKIDEGNYIVHLGSEKYRVTLTDEGLLINNEPALISGITELLALSRVERGEAESEKTPYTGKGEIRAPLSGKIAEVKVSKGSRISVGTVVALMVSMKMVVEVKSSMEGVVEEVYVKPGQTVKTGDLIVKVRAEEKEEKKS